MNFDFIDRKKSKLNGGASPESILKVEKKLGISLPRAIREFLRFSDGALIDKRAIFFSAKDDLQTHEDLLSFNNSETVKEFLRIGRFSEDEFGYRCEDLQDDDPAVYVLDHETEEFHKEADNLVEFLKKYNDYEPPKKKWWSFLMQ